MKEFFNENNGQSSSTRLIFLMVLFMRCFLQPFTPLRVPNPQPVKLLLYLR